MVFDWLVDPSGGTGDWNAFTPWMKKLPKNPAQAIIDVWPTSGISASEVDIRIKGVVVAIATTDADEVIDLLKGLGDQTLSMLAGNPTPSAAASEAKAVRHVAQSLFGADLVGKEKTQTLHLLGDVPATAYDPKGPKAPITGMDVIVRFSGNFYPTDNDGDSWFLMDATTVGDNQNKSVMKLNGDGDPPEGQLSWDGNTTVEGEAGPKTKTPPEERKESFKTEITSRSSVINDTCRVDVDLQIKTGADTELVFDNSTMLMIESPIVIVLKPLHGG
jgi:hypothetical protein